MAEWVVSIKKFYEDGKEKFKVTRMLPEMGVAETKMFYSEKKALKQLKDWLNG